MTPTTDGDERHEMDLDGILFFPVTPFDTEGSVSTEALEAHISAGLVHGPGGVFAACGTGEVHALSVGEHAEVVRTAVAAAAGSGNAS